MYKKLILSMLCGGLIACNNGGSQVPMNDNPELNSAESKELNWRFSWSAPITSIFNKGLGWYVMIQNDSDYSYTVKAIPGSSRVKGTDTWEEDTELDRETIVEPHTSKVIHGESYTDGPKSFKLTASGAKVREQIITLHKDRTGDNFDFYITNDTSHSIGEAVFNHGADRTLQAPATIASLVGDAIAIIGGAVIGEEVAKRIATRSAFREMMKDYSVKETSVLPARIAEREASLLDKQTGLKQAINDLEYIRSLESPKPLTSAQQQQSKLLPDIINKGKFEIHTAALDQVSEEVAAEYNARYGLNLSRGDLSKFKGYLSYLHNANNVTKQHRRALQTLNDEANQHLIPIRTTDNLASLEKVLKDSMRRSSEAKIFFNKVFKASGFVVPTSTRVFGVAIGALFGSGASAFWTLNVLDIAGKDAVFTGVQVDNSGLAKVGQFNDAPVGPYLMSCDNLGTDESSNTTMAVCNHNKQLNVSFLNVNLNLRPHETIVDKDGEIQGSDQYHDYCSGSYIVNGIIYALCKTDTKAEAKLELLDYAHDCADGAEVRYEEQRLVCSKYRYQYLKSCTPITVTQPEGINGMITAQCKGENGVLHEGFTTLDSKLCASGSDIINKDASLICASYRSDIPQGSYLQSGGVDFYDRKTSYPYASTLAASCKDSTGYVSQVTLDYVKECEIGSTVSLSPKGYLRCDTYQHYLVTDLHNKGKVMELQRLLDLGKIQN
ncbi:MAG: hypothetical protein K2X94_04240 [Amoebophilaceae bacterium]|nr:hypothetical protein [Amoebophilaceae bacterium]